MQDHASRIATVTDPIAARAAAEDAEIGLADTFDLLADTNWMTDGLGIPVIQFIAIQFLIWLVGGFALGFVARVGAFLPALPLLAFRDRKNGQDLEQAASSLMNTVAFWPLTKAKRKSFRGVFWFIALTASIGSITAGAIAYTKMTVPFHTMEFDWYVSSDPVFQRPEVTAQTTVEAASWLFLFQRRLQKASHMSSVEFEHDEDFNLFELSKEKFDRVIGGLSPEFISLVAESGSEPEAQWRSRFYRTETEQKYTVLKSGAYGRRIAMGLAMIDPLSSIWNRYPEGSRYDTIEFDDVFSVTEDIWGANTRMLVFIGESLSFGLVVRVVVFFVFGFVVWIWSKRTGKDLDPEHTPMNWPGLLIETDRMQIFVWVLVTFAAGAISLQLMRGF
ncbi:MAG: hypothetical protein AAGB48_08350 [Planctomycetota bacterium]